MKKLLFIIILLLSVSSLFAKVYTLKNDFVKLDITVTENNNVYISSIKDIKTNEEFIGEIDKNNSLWNITLKKGNYSNPNTEKIYPYNAKNIDVKEDKNKLVITFSGVSSDKVDEEFTLISTITQKDNNNYFELEILKGKEWGIWEFDYPYIGDLNCIDGDEFFIPSRGDVIVKEFSNPKGFPDPASDDLNKYTKKYSYNHPLCLQYSSLTKGKSTLYMCSEDTTGHHKAHSWTSNKTNSMNVFTTYFPANMGIPGYGFKTKNKFNIALVEGDYYNAAKYYRKWGIKVNYAPFSHGKIENRKDIPKWWKELNLISRTWGKAGVTETLKATEIFKCPILVQLYMWGAYYHDTYYPNWLPINEEYKEYIKQFKDAGCYLLPYTNAHLVDSALSDIVKENPEIVKKTWQGKTMHEPWAENRGAYNNVACTSSDYYNLFIDEMKRIFEAYPFDAVYLDQVGATSFGACFNEKHNHPLGGGTFAKKDYTNMVRDLRKDLKEITGKDIVFTTEDSGDEIFFDAWKTVNEGKLKSEDNKVRNYIYSGYVSSFGDKVYPNEIDDEWPAINKIGSELTKGHMLGWQLLMEWRFYQHPIIIEYMKEAIKAREAAVKYFNLGEMVRDINITSEIPKVPVRWYHFSTKDTGFQGEAKGIKSCVYYYHGKAMVCITNTSKEKVHVEWMGDPKEMYLKEKKSYKISQMYPNKTKGETVEVIGGKLDINSLETVIFLIE